MRAFSSLLKMAAFVAAVFFSSAASAQTYYFWAATVAAGSPKYAMQPSGITCTKNKPADTASYRYEADDCAVTSSGTQYAYVIRRCFVDTTTCPNYSAPVMANKTHTTCLPPKYFRLDANLGGLCVDEPPPTCAEKAGDSAGWFSQVCFHVTCQGGTFQQDVTDSFFCSAGIFKSLYVNPINPRNVDGCEATHKQRVMPQKNFPKTDKGKSSSVVYCDDEYEFTGEEFGANEVGPTDPSPPGSPSPQDKDLDPLPEVGTPGSGSGDGSGDGSGNGSGSGSGTGGSTGGGGTGTGDGGGGDGDGSGSAAGYSECKASGPPTCKGDALLCAQLRQMWVATCDVHKTLSKVTPEQKKISDDELTAAKTEFQAQQEASEAQLTGFLSQFEGQLNPGAGECLPDQNISVMGKSVDIPFSQACDYFQAMRALILIFAMLRALKIITDAF